MTTTPRLFDLVLQMTPRQRYDFRMSSPVAEAVVKAALTLEHWQHAAERTDAYMNRVKAGQDATSN